MPNSDAVLVVSFGGPERREDVLPFLDNVLRGRSVPRERMLEVAEHYYRFGGRSPINDQNRAVIAALKALLAKEGPELPVYWGNRNWYPLLRDTLRCMCADGITRAYAYVTSAFGSYSGCRQYLENLSEARQQAGATALEILKLRLFFNHPGFIESTTDRVREATGRISWERRESAALVFTAHSIPTAMAAGSPYVSQLTEACKLVSGALGRQDYRLVYQSRSGPVGQSWLEPDILDYLRDLGRRRSVRDVIIVPIGFLSDHMEVLYDLDTEAYTLCEQLGLNMVRAATVGADSRIINMIRELVLERRSGSLARRALGTLGAAADSCATDCCPAPQRFKDRASAAFSHPGQP